MLAVVFIVCILGLFGSLVYIDHIRISRGFQKFNENSIRGEIAQLEMAKSRIMIRLKDDDIKYYLYQEARSHRKADFYETVHPGDSILKKAFSDSVIIRRGNISNVYIIAR